MPVLGALPTPCSFTLVLNKFERWDVGNEMRDSQLKGGGSYPKGRLNSYRATHIIADTRIWKEDW